MSIGGMPEFPAGDSDNRDVYEAVNNVRSGQPPPAEDLELFKVILARYEKMVEDERERQAGLSALAI